MGSIFLPFQVLTVLFIRPLYIGDVGNITSSGEKGNELMNEKGN